MDEPARTVRKDADSGRGQIGKRALPVYEPSAIMKSIVLASALWLLLAFLMAVLVGKLIKGVGRRHRPRSDTPFSASAGLRGSPGRIGEQTSTLPGKILSHPSLHKKVRTVSGLQLLIERYVAQLNELEARMADVNRKLEIITETSRLLEEEGLSEANPPPIVDKKTFL